MLQKMNNKLIDGKFIDYHDIYHINRIHFQQTTEGYLRP